MAAIVGAIYITKYRVDNLTRYFVYFLWITVFVEVVFGWFTVCIYHFESFSFFKGTFLEKNNYPIYNLYYIVSFAFYIFYFRNYFKKKEFIVSSNLMILLYVVGSVVSLFLTDAFFLRVSSFIYIVGSILIFLGVIFYFFEIFKSDKILTFYKSITFYVSIGAIIFHLSVTPIFIYGSYYSNSKDPEFVQIYKIILTVANIFMYTCYTIGFIICSRKNKSY